MNIEVKIIVNGALALSHGPNQCTLDSSASDLNDIVGKFFNLNSKRSDGDPPIDAGANYLPSGWTAGGKK
jgi:hypothetical protein